MPTLKQLTCTIEKEPSRSPLKEYGTNYSDGFVESYIAVPNQRTGFSVHLKSTGYIAPGLAMFVYIDGVYQCNRNRHNLLPPDGTIPSDFYEIDFRVLQKEEKMGKGRFLGRAWCFDSLDIDKDSNVQDAILGNLGTIEVVVLRVRSSDKQAALGPLRPNRDRNAKKVIGTDGAADSAGTQNFGASLDGPNDGYHHERNGRRHRSRHYHDGKGSPKSPLHDFGPSYADYLRWRDTHPDAAASTDTRAPRGRSSSYYDDQYRPDSEQPGQHSDPRGDHQQQRHRMRATHHGRFLAPTTEPNPSPAAASQTSESELTRRPRMSKDMRPDAHSTTDTCTASQARAPRQVPDCSPRTITYPSYRAGQPDESLASSESFPGPLYNPRYPPEPSTRNSDGNSKMPGGWQDPMDSAKKPIPNPFSPYFFPEQRGKSITPSLAIEYPACEATIEPSQCDSDGQSGDRASSKRPSSIDADEVFTPNESIGNEINQCSGGWDTRGGQVRGESDQNGWGAENWKTAGGSNEQWGQGDTPDQGGSPDTSANWNCDDVSGNNVASGFEWGVHNGQDNAANLRSGDNNASGSIDKASNFIQQKVQSSLQDQAAGNTTGDVSALCGHAVTFQDKNTQQSLKAEKKNDPGQSTVATDRKSSTLMVGGNSKASSSKAASSITASTFVHKPMVPEQPFIKGYWQSWNAAAPSAAAAATPTGRSGYRQPEHTSPDTLSEAFAPSEAPYVVPARTLREQLLDKYVHHGKAYSYTHATGRPVYADDLDAPYAVFRFKYRSSEMLGRLLGRGGRKELDREQKRECYEERERELSSLTKDELIKRLVAKGEIETKSTAPDMGYGQKKQGKTPRMTSQPSRSTNDWGADIAAATAPGTKGSSRSGDGDGDDGSGSGSADEPMTCDKCTARLVGEWWHCNSCGSSGDGFDVCLGCVGKKMRCNNETHNLVKWRDDVVVAVNGPKGPGPINERLQGIRNESNGKKDGE